LPHDPPCPRADIVDLLAPQGSNPASRLETVHLRHPLIHQYEIEIVRLCGLHRGRPSGDAPDLMAGGGCECGGDVPIHFDIIINEYAQLPCYSMHGRVTASRFRKCKKTQNKEAVLFEKRTKGSFVSWLARPVRSLRIPKIKVFWFFFSKKNCFLPNPQPAQPVSLRARRPPPPHPGRPPARGRAAHRRPCRRPRYSRPAPDPRR